MRGRDSLFLLGALLLHVGGILAARTIAPQFILEHAAIDAGEKTGPLAEMAVDLLPDEPRAREYPRIEPPPLPEHAPPTRHAPARPEPRAAPPTAREPSTGLAANESAPLDEYGAPPSSATWTAPPGLGGAPVWALPGGTPAPPAPAGPLAPVRRLRPIAAPSVADKTGPSILFFPSAGTLASAVAAEVSSSFTPGVSESSFELSLDAKGNLVSARFLTATTGNGNDWRRIARAVQKRFSGRALPMNGDFASGARITVHVTSRVTMPDGSAHGIPMPKPSYVGRPSIIPIDSRDDRHGKLPSGEKARVALEFEADLANIGAQRRRVVHTRVAAVPVTSP